MVITNPRSRPAADATARRERYVSPAAMAVVAAVVVLAIIVVAVAVVTRQRASEVSVGWATLPDPAGAASAGSPAVLGSPVGVAAGNGAGGLSLTAVPASATHLVLRFVCQGNGDLSITAPAQSLTHETCVDARSSMYLVDVNGWFHGTDEMDLSVTAGNATVWRLAVTAY